ncbi:phosphatidylserine decarboxylase [Savitreella phatthalungensis]
MVHLAALPGKLKSHLTSKGKSKDDDTFPDSPLKLKVKLIRARNLAAKDRRSRKSDPYLLLRFNNSTASTKVISNNLDPVWDETKTFPLHKSHGYRLEIVAWDWDRFSSKDYLGEFTINLKQHFAHHPLSGGGTSQWHSLKSFRSGRKSSFVSGDVEIMLWLEGASPEDDLEPLWHAFLESIDESPEKAVANARPDMPVGMQRSEDVDRVMTMDSTECSSEEEDTLGAVDSDRDDEPASDEEEQPHTHTTPTQAPPKRRRRLRKRRHVAAPFQFTSSSARDTLGLVFLEIVSATDLPRERNVTKTSFDMDPFVVTSFSKKVFRTRVVRHSLNPQFNDKVLFQVHRHEANFSLQFNVIDRDKLSGNDFVGSTTLDVGELISNGPKADTNTGLYNVESIEAPAVAARPKKQPKAPRIGAVKRQDTASSTTSLEDDLASLKIADPDMRQYDLPITIAANVGWTDKVSPRLQIKAKYVPYPALRQQFWRTMLRHYDVDETGLISRVELTTMLDSLGATLRDSTVDGFYARFGKLSMADEEASSPSDGLTIDECIICLEDHLQGLTTRPPSRTSATAVPRPQPARMLSTLDDDDAAEYLINISQCPICNKAHMNRKAGVDIVTHLATCASQDWRKVDHLVMGDFVTPSQASRKWYTKIITKVGYGGYKLGANSANILVQDRRTGQIQEERMSVYVRLGIRLLYKGIKSSRMETSRIRKLLKSMSVKQGVKYDSPNSAKDIAAFINFHQLDMSEVLEPVENFHSFNEFFYRKLKPGARPCTGTSEIAVSPADCRSVVFNELTTATQIWVKGQNFSLSRLFGDAYPEDASLFEGGALGIFRLAPQDYHRFHVPCDGIVGQPRTIAGQYYTVNPMAIRSSLDVYGENVRVCVPIDSPEFGRVMAVCVGAMMVGSTVITAEAGQSVKRGDELGFFKFGGSTVLLLFQKGKFVFDEDLVGNSNSAIETLLRVGSSIGHPPGVPDAPSEKITNPTTTDKAEANRRLAGSMPPRQPDAALGDSTKTGILSALKDPAQAASDAKASLLPGHIS